MNVDATVANWFFVAFALVYWLTHLPFDFYMLAKKKLRRYPGSDFASLRHGFLIISTTLVFWLSLCIKPFVYFLTGHDFLSINKHPYPAVESILRLIGMTLMTIGLVIACLGRIGRGAYLSSEKPKLATTWGHAIVRHPEYFMYIVAFVGLPLAAYSWLLLYLLFGINAYIKLANMEEKVLLLVFEDEYKAYQKRVGKLFPKITSWKKKDNSS